MSGRRLVITAGGRAPLSVARVMAVGLVVMLALASAVAAEAVTFTLPGSGYASVAVGYRQVCAVRADTSITCWGNNQDGAAAPPVGAYIAVAGGDQTVCAIRTDQTLACWGFDGPAHQAQPPAGPVTAVSVGRGIGCAIRIDQTLACWGQPVGTNDPANPSHGPPVGTFAQISSGYDVSCALRTDSTAYCWGVSASGQTLPPPGTFTSIGVSSAFGCAIRTDRTLACWGAHGYIGDHHETVPPAGEFAALSVASAEAFACAIHTDRTLVCWGTNFNHQTETPAGAYTAVSSGYSTACAISTDTTITCWGGAIAGVATAPPVVTPPVVIPPVTPTPVVCCAPPTPARISAAAAFTLPSARKCVSRRRFTIRVRKVRGVTWVGAVVKVAGKRVKTVKRSRITAPINLVGLPKGRFTVAITATASDGRVVTGTRRYRTCTPKRRSPGPRL